MRRKGSSLPVVAGVIVVVLVLVGYLVLRGGGGAETGGGVLDARAGDAAGYNVLLITVDTTRADRLGCYGYAGAETPVLDGLAAGGVLFSDAVTCVPMTLPSHATILTGDYPPRHGVRDNGTFRLAPKRVTLAERLKTAGYDTFAVLAAFVLDRRFGLDQGFDTYDDAITLKYREAGVRQASPQRPADAVVDSAIAWLDARSTSAGSGVDAGGDAKPFFMWVHLFDPHSPCLPPEPFATRFAGRGYDGEVAFMDSQIGRLMESLRGRGLSDRTVTVVVGDHGEGLGDHGESTHSLLIYESTMHVPFILHAPGVLAGGNVVGDRVVSTADVVPTVLGLLGLDIGADGCDGANLLKAIPADRVVYMETMAPELNHGWSALYASRRHADKYIESPSPEYFDLSSDPGEMNNLYDARQRDAAEIAQLLVAMMEAFPTEVHAEASVSVDEEAMEKLAALGYLRGGGDDDGGSGDGGSGDGGSGVRPDPKVMILRWESQIAKVRMFVDQGRFDEAIPILEALLKIAPDDARMWSLVAYAHGQAGRIDEAIAARMTSIGLQPGDANHWLHLAQLQFQKGDEEAGALSLAEAERVEPNHGEIFLIRAHRAFEREAYEEAVQYCEEARRRDPTRHFATSWGLQGKVYEAWGRVADAKLAFEKAYRADSRDSGALAGMARVALAAGDGAGAVRFAERILQADADWSESRGILARAYLSMGEGDKAIEAMRTLTEHSPENAWAFNYLGNVCFSLDRLEEASEAYGRAVALDGAYATAQYNLGVVLVRLGDEEGALEHLKGAVAADAGMSAAWLMRARIHANRGEIDEGLACLKRVLELGGATASDLMSDAKLQPLTGTPEFATLGDGE